MPYSDKAVELRRCTANRKDGTRCTGWAVWGDPQRRCAAHGGRRAVVPGDTNKTMYQPCRCVAYSWPHRPGSGLCRWPDPPTHYLPTKAGTHSPNRSRPPRCITSLGPAAAFLRKVQPWMLRGHDTRRRRQ